MKFSGLLLLTSCCQRKNWFVARILKWFHLHLLSMFEWGNKLRNALEIWTFFYLNQPRLTSLWTHWSLKLDKKIQPKEKTLKDLLMLCLKLKNSTIIQALSKYQNKHWSLYKSITLLSYNIYLSYRLFYFMRLMMMIPAKWNEGHAMVQDKRLQHLYLGLEFNGKTSCYDSWCRSVSDRIELNWISSDPVHCHITKSNVPPTSFLYE